MKWYMACSLVRRGDGRQHAKGVAAEQDQVLGVRPPRRGMARVVDVVDGGKRRVCFSVTALQPPTSPVSLGPMAVQHCLNLLGLLFALLPDGRSSAEGLGACLQHDRGLLDASSADQCAAAPTNHIRFCKGW